MKDSEKFLFFFMLFLLLVRGCMLSDQIDEIHHELIQINNRQTP